MFRRATYYLRPDQIKALKVRAAAEERQLSDVMREAVDQYLRRRS
jgi:plasmid stability protein